MSNGASRPPTRRSVLKVLGAVSGAAAGAAALGMKGAGAAEEAPAKKAPGPKHRWGMAIDLDRCTACGGCVVACQAENNVAPLGPEVAEKTRGIYWMDLLTQIGGTYPDVQARTLPMPCMHCDDPPCAKVCPVGATYKNEEGIVAQVWDRCIGCRYCMAACPYARRYYNWSEPEWPGLARSMLNPDVATRVEGIVEKCTLCHHRIRDAKAKAASENRPLTDAEVQYLPACAQACPARAITFGDLDDPKSEVSRQHKSPRAFSLLEEIGTHPKVVYLRDTKWRE